MQNHNQKEKLSSIHTVMFDIVGTLVDSYGTIKRETVEVFEKNGLNAEQAEEVVKRWREIQPSYIKGIISHERPWLVEEQVRREVIKTVLKEKNLSLPSEEIEKVATVGRRFKPWPEASRQLNDLRKLVKTTGLTNSGFSQIVDMSKQAGFSWDALLSAQFVHSYKPDPAVYQFAIEVLEISPSEVLFIAAHPWDLRAAAAQGFKTAYLPREHTKAPEPDDQFDFYLETLDDLIELLKEVK